MPTEMTKVVPVSGDGALFRRGTTVVLIGSPDDDDVMDQIERLLEIEDRAERIRSIAGAFLRNRVGAAAVADLFVGGVDLFAVGDVDVVGSDTTLSAADQVTGLSGRWMEDRLRAVVLGDVTVGDPLPWVRLDAGAVPAAGFLLAGSAGPDQDPVPSAAVGAAAGGTVSEPDWADGLDEAPVTPALPEGASDGAVSDAPLDADAAMPESVEAAPAVDGEMLPELDESAPVVDEEPPPVVEEETPPVVVEEELPPPPPPVVEEALPPPPPPVVEEELPPPPPPVVEEALPPPPPPVVEEALPPPAAQEQWPPPIADVPPPPPIADAPPPPPIADVPPPPPIADAPPPPPVAPAPPSTDYQLVSLTASIDLSDRTPVPTLESSDETGDAESDMPTDDLPTYAQPVKVLGVLSPRGFFNHPEARFCSRTGVKMGASETKVLVQGERPALGVLTFDDGSTYTVQWNTIIGRDPRIDDLVASGAAAPLSLTDDELKISRRHIALELNDWDVLIADLDTANGTYVRSSPAEQPRRLARGEKVVLGSGSEVFLGDRSFVFHEHHVR